MSLHIDIQGHGPDLVLLHGWAMHSGVFDALLPALTQQYRVHCIDLPGHGRSLYSPAMSDLHRLADLVRPYVPGRASVLGWSLGGLLALKIAQRAPLAKLVLVSATPKFVATADWLAGMAQPVFAQFFSRLQHNLRVTVQDFLALQVRGDSDATHTLKQLREALLQHPGDERALQLGLQILRDADERLALPAIHTPTLVVTGEYDRITHPRAGEYLAAHLPQAQLFTLHRAGHAPFISHQQEFMERLLAFLAGNHA